MITIAIFILVGASLAWLDYRRLSISDAEYKIAQACLIVAILINIIINPEAALIFAAVGIGTYAAFGWYLKRYVAAADRRIIMLSLLAFPIQSFGGLAAVALRGSIRRHPYYPALTYFFIGFIVLTILIY
jgi:hypothetical protein